MTTKSIRLISAFALATIAGACDGPPTAPVASTATGKTAAVRTASVDGAQATPWRSHRRIDVSRFVGYVPCADDGAGEWVKLAGTIHDRIQSFSVAPGEWMVTAHRNAQGLHGMGLRTGNDYVGSMTDNWTSVYLGPGASTTDRYAVRFVGKGAAEDWSLVVTYRYQIDANGVVHGEVDDWEYTCR